MSLLCQMLMNVLMAPTTVLRFQPFVKTPMVPSPVTVFLDTVHSFKLVQLALQCLLLFVRVSLMNGLVLLLHFLCCFLVYLVVLLAKFMT